MESLNSTLMSTGLDETLNSSRMSTGDDPLNDALVQSSPAPIEEEDVALVSA